jgi:hypothetical protein
MHGGAVRDEADHVWIGDTIAIVVQTVTHFNRYLTARTAGVRDTFVDVSVAVVVRAIASFVGKLVHFAVAIVIYVVAEYSWRPRIRFCVRVIAVTRQDAIRVGVVFAGRLCAVTIAVAIDDATLDVRVAGWG